MAGFPDDGLAIDPEPLTGCPLLRGLDVLVDLEPVIDKDLRLKIADQLEQLFGFPCLPAFAGKVLGRRVFIPSSQKSHNVFISIPCIHRYKIRMK